MRAIITTLTAALFVLATSFPTQATNSRSNHYGSHHHGQPPAHICKIVIIIVPKIIWASWGHGDHHHGPKITYIKIKKVICHRPISRDDWSDDDGWDDDWSHGHGWH